MAKLNIDQQSIKELFIHKKSDFLIPDYQRPYAWGKEECETLWEDLFAFAFPDNDCDKFNNDDEYFLGPIVTYPNNNKFEVIDGQQRLTTLMLLLRAFYKKFENMQDQKSILTKKSIEQCIWKTDEFGTPDLERLKINSEVATDNDKEEFLTVLRTGDAQKEQKSAYANNYRFFEEQIQNFLSDFPSYFAYFPTRILNNCILLPIEAESQDTALRIFSTLNDRGKPLSDADIFKAQFYKYYSNKNKKDEFINKWKELEELCNKIFHPIAGTPMDELFTRYMYFERAKMGIKSSTTEALRKFYEKDKYKLLNEESFSNLIELAQFWNDIYAQDNERFSDDALRNLFVLNYAPNGMWSYLVSVYFMANKDNEGNLNNDDFRIFLEKIIAFIWTYAIINPGVNALRTPVFAEMINIVNKQPVDFSDFKFDEKTVRTAIDNFYFYNRRPITKSMLAWWALHNQKQKCPDLDTVFDIEHIYAKKRFLIKKSIVDEKVFESLGNKSLLEKRINIRAADYNFCDKVKYYQGDKGRQGKSGTQIQELLTISSNPNKEFDEHDILERYNKIVNAFMENLKENNLLK